jgi:hypothetical protein
VVEAADPEHVIPPRTRLMLEEMFPAKEQRRDRDRGPERDTGLDIGF